MGDFEVEIGSISAAASWMTDNVLTTAQQLTETMADLRSYTELSDWSAVPSCREFAASYSSAVDAYQAVAADLLEDAGKMRDALQHIATSYTKTDDDAVDRLSKAVAAIGTQGYMTHSDADHVYQQHRGDLHSDHPQEAPAQDADTGSSGSSTSTTTPAPTTTGGSQKSAS